MARYAGCNASTSRLSPSQRAANLHVKHLRFVSVSSLHLALRWDRPLWGISRYIRQQVSLPYKFVLARSVFGQRVQRYYGQLFEDGAGLPVMQGSEHGVHCVGGSVSGLPSEVKEDVRRLSLLYRNTIDQLRT